MSFYTGEEVRFLGSTREELSDLSVGDIGTIEKSVELGWDKWYLIKFRGKTYEFGEGTNEIELNTLDIYREDKSLKKNKLIIGSKVRLRYKGIYVVREHTQYYVKPHLVSENGESYVQLEDYDNNLNHRRGYKELDIVEVL